MESPSTSSPFLKLLGQALQEGVIPSKYLELLKDFYLGYHNVVPQKADSLFITFLALIKEQTLSPFTFEPFHRQIRTPFDYYQFGLDLIRPLVDQPASSLRGLPYLAEIVSLIEKGENVIFLANHQVEADPQAISLLLEDHSPRLAEEMIFVAGERVITDPLAIPASKGRNLLCIYSKRYIDNPPEHKSEKQRHNRKTMELMSALLSEGGKAIYVAPSGGRDRPNPDGVFTVSPYDAQSIEMFYLMAERAGHPTHFYPLALKTYAILPPPQTIQVELGEARTVAKAPIHLSLGPRIDMEHFPGSDIPDKHARRSARATYIHSLVSTDYSQFP